VIGVESCEEVYDLSFCFALLRVDLGVLVLARDWPADSPKGRFLPGAKTSLSILGSPVRRFIKGKNFQHGAEKTYVATGGTGSAGWWRPFQRRSHAWGWKQDHMKENDYNQ
jgi:hypothetical protein